MPFGPPVFDRLLLPASIAGLNPVQPAIGTLTSVQKPCTSNPPPKSANGSSRGSVFCWSPGFFSPPLSSDERLLPRDMIVAPAPEVRNCVPPPVLLATIVL